MKNLKGARTCLETFDLKPNYSELGRMYGIDRRTAKKRYHGIENKSTKVKSSKLDKHFELIKEKLKIPGTNMKAIYMYINLKTKSKFILMNCLKKCKFPLTPS